VIGVILSGTRGDGAVGLAAVKASGGGTIVQDPAEAAYAGMPTTALAHVAVDAVVPSELVADTIVAMVKGEDPPPAATPDDPRVDPTAGEPGVTVCPECGGVLSERVEAGVRVWECRVGHRYSPEGLVDAQAVSIEAAMWMAIRALEDRARLLEEMADHSEARGMMRSTKSFRQRAEAALEQARTVRKALMRAAELTLTSPEQDEADAVSAGGGS
jgi:two-component system chemotaxis response regulator CheB